MKYNEEKERKAKWDAKQKELARIEDAKKHEAEKGFSLVYCQWCQRLCDIFWVLVLQT